MIDYGRPLLYHGSEDQQRSCPERLMPPGRDRLVSFDLPPLQSADDFSLRVASILQAVSEAKITPQEGEVLKTRDSEQRMRNLEQPSVSEETTATPIEDDLLC